MRTALIHDLAGIDAIESQWTELTIARGNAFTSPQWVRAWAEQTTQQLAIAAVHRDDGSLAGVMPMAVDRPRRGTVRFAGAALGDRFGPVCMPGDEAEVATAGLAAIVASDLRPAMTILHRIDADSDWSDRVGVAGRRGTTRIVQSPADLLYIPAGETDWEGYLATRSSKFRQRVVRGLEKTLAKEHEFAVRESNGPSELETDLDTLYRLHDLRHAEDSSIAAGSDREVLRAFAGAASDAGWLRLRLLEVEGTPVAAFLGWHIGGSYGIYQSGFDPEWARYSVGMLLLVTTVRAGFEENAVEVDMLLGEEDYKQRFAAATRQVHTVTLVPSLSRARLLVGAEAAARKRARGLADRPHIGAALKRAARLLPTGRRG